MLSDQIRGISGKVLHYRSNLVSGVPLYIYTEMMVRGKIDRYEAFLTSDVMA